MWPEKPDLTNTYRLLDHVRIARGATWLDVNEQNELALGFWQRIGFDLAGR
jgi:ribosomal protein S18 acetylase RimI-like enzyme